MEFCFGSQWIICPYFSFLGWHPSPRFTPLSAFGNDCLQLDCRNKGRKKSYYIIDSTLFGKDKDKKLKQTRTDTKLRPLSDLKHSVLITLLWIDKDVRPLSFIRVSRKEGAGDPSPERKTVLATVRQQLPKSNQDQHTIQIIIVMDVSAIDLCAK